MNYYPIPLGKEENPLYLAFYEFDIFTREQTLLKKSELPGVPDYRLHSINGTNVGKLSDCPNDLLKDFNTPIIDPEDDESDEDDEETQARFSVSQETLDGIVQNSFCIPDSVNLTTYTEGESTTLTSLELDSSQFSSIFKNNKIILVKVGFQVTKDIPNNKEIAYRRMWKTETFALDQTRMRYEGMEFQKETIQQDTPIFLYTTSESYTLYSMMHRYSKYDMVIQGPTAGIPYLSVVLEFNKLTQKRSYRYYGFEDAMAEGGGVFATLLIFAALISDRVLPFWMESYIVNESFSFHEKKEDDSNQDSSREGYDDRNRNDYKRDLKENDAVNNTDGYNEEKLPDNTNDLKNKPLNMKKNNLNSELDQFKSKKASINKFNPGSDRNYLTAEEIDEIIKGKESWKAKKPGCCDMFCIFFKGEFCIKLNSYEKIVSKAMSLILNSTDVVSSVKTSIDGQEMKKLLFGEHMKDYMYVPSLNLKNPKTEEVLNNYLQPYEKLYDWEDNEKLKDRLSNINTKNEVDKQALDNILVSLK
eukprot:CAMPEP_0170519028 /NCGR_PEP_ID=MMETSP0209-20121228/4582_1 /TAXON_ID=665100 ORGANISM="Litonotus pictus, Strain P1" /NCGR_SAMPLE_ID=MMETSP0209 /ASSEMBLY_ACC=CAM_ASM_000301 /LENGTH=530 /DNA_ID=CAMNT_0010804807 /DNA_START=208 /DNA_END=1800 /DNA_ORIENTATION=-